MRFVWNKTSVVVWLIVFGVVFPLQGLFAEGAGEKSNENTAAGIQPQPHHLVVTYFHTTYRCPTCEKLEELSNQAVKLHFDDAMASGRLVWRVINVETPEHKHFIRDYGLYSKHLIVSEVKDGKEIRWKDLKDIWTLVRNEEKFDQYVNAEITEWLGE